MGSSAILFASALTAETGKPISISEALRQPQAKLFRIERKDGKYQMGDKASHFNGKTDFDRLTFDISNNKVLANIGVQGAVQHLTIYRDSYRSNCGKGGKEGGWPGVWMAKDASTYGPYSFSIVADGKTEDLSKVDWDFRTGLLDNIFPITELYDPKGRFVARTIAFAPISADGERRLRGIVYGLEIENISETNFECAVLLPTLSYPLRKSTSIVPDSWVPTSWASFDPYDFDIASGDSAGFKPELVIKLGKGEKIWIPSIIYMPGEPTVEEVNSCGTFAWLMETHGYYRKILGRLDIPGNDFLAEFHEREVLQSLQSIAMSASGNFAGSNWGSYPATRQIWQKDCFYSALPFMQIDPSLARKTILWFDEFGVRQTGTAVPGGVNHSIGLSVAAPLLAGIYYEATADKSFFHKHPEFMARWNKILDEIVESRIDRDVWLFPTHFISDGPVTGDYHAGSQICVWKALKSQSRLLAEIWGDPSKSEEFSRIADKVKASLLEKNIVGGSVMVESAWRAGRTPEMFSDGEESDTTLMPFYGFLGYNDKIFKDSMRFAMSAENKNYNPKLYALKWNGVPSTAPGYNKGLCAGSDRESLFGEHGYYTELRRVTDADGSVWWWTYCGKGDPEYGNVKRGFGFIGKAGWFAGVHSVIFRDLFLGIRYDATANRLSFNPHPATGDFSFTGFPAGTDCFSIEYKKGTAVFTNSSAHEVFFSAGSSGPVKVSPGESANLKLAGGHE